MDQLLEPFRVPCRKSLGEFPAADLDGDLFRVFYDIGWETAMNEAGRPEMGWFGRAERIRPGGLQ